MLSLVGLLAVSLPVAGCDDDPADATFEPESVPESKPIDELDDAEEEAFCEEAKDWADDIVGDQLSSILCNSFAIGSSFGEDGTLDLAQCRSEREACLNDPDSTGEFDVETEGLECNFDEVENCGATVGEFSDCFEEAAQLLDRTANDITCERIADGDVPNEADYLLSAQCEALFERCSGEEQVDTQPPPE